MQFFESPVYELCRVHVLHTQKIRVKRGIGIVISMPDCIVSFNKYVVQEAGTG